MVSHGVFVIVSDTIANLLVLGGTTEANRLAQRLAQESIRATYSYAGRVNAPRAQPIPTRSGGFGGVGGLIAYLQKHNITHVVDATHPFAAGMSANAMAACEATRTPLLRFTRPAWASQEGDDWRHVVDIEAAVEALAGPARRVMLAVGRQHIEAFAAQPQHHYVLRLVDTPDTPPGLPEHTVVVARGPFSLEGDIALFRDLGVEVVVSKNSGGEGARAKLDAARQLGLPVIMIDRPALPNSQQVGTVDAVMAWLADTQGAAPIRG